MCVCVPTVCAVNPVHATHCVSIIKGADRDFVGIAKAGWTPFAEVKLTNKSE